MGKMAPLLKSHNVRLVGIGVEIFGAGEFVDGKFWPGELYIDVKKEQYKALGYKRYNGCNIWCAMCTKMTREQRAKTAADGISYNWSGDGFQNGGTIIVEKGGGRVLLSHKMNELADHVSNADVLRALGIDVTGSFEETAVTVQPKAQTGARGLSDTP